MATHVTLSPELINGTRIRGGGRRDLPAIARLMARAHTADHLPRLDPDELTALADRGQLIVLELRPHELSAAACVANGRGLVFLVLDPEVASDELEHRMLGVADALCRSAA